MKPALYEIRLTEPAEHDFLEIMQWSVERFGARAADRYETLIGQALIDVGEDPFRPGARARPDLRAGTYTFHLSSSCERVRGDRVKTPRHFLIYRIVSACVEVLRILHDSRDLAKHLPES